MSDTVVAALKKIVADDLDLNIQAVVLNEKTPLFERGLALDSIATMELITCIEQRFGIVFTDSELIPANFQNLEVLAELIKDKRRKPV